MNDKTFYALKEKAGSQSNRWIDYLPNRTMIEAGRRHYNTIRPH